MDKVNTKRRRYVESASSCDTVAHIGGDFTFTLLNLRRLMSYIYIYGAPILDVSRPHTTTQHSR